MIIILSMKGGSAQSSVNNSGEKVTIYPVRQVDMTLTLFEARQEKACAPWTLKTRQTYLVTKGNLPKSLYHRHHLTALQLNEICRYEIEAMQERIRWAEICVDLSAAVFSKVSLSSLKRIQSG